MNTSTDLTFRVTSQALRAVRRGDQAWIQAHLALAAFVEMGGIPISGRYRRRNLVFYRIGNRQYAREYVIPRDPRTLAQQDRRAIMRWLAPEWQRLSQKQQDAWIAAAEKVWSRRRLTPTRPQTPDCVKPGPIAVTSGAPAATRP